MRLLLAEDERALSKALTAILERNNYSVDAVYDGQSALDYLEADNYDGVVLDIMMPKVDGLTVLRKVRERGNLIPILLLTAKSEVDDKVEGLDAGANDYLAKPFHSKELLARIRAITRAQTAQANSSLSTQPSENSVFSRLFACVILKPYVFSLVFALMSENKGNFLLFAADYLIQQPCGSTLRFPCSVSVDIHCGTDISVSEKLLHILWGSPI